MGLRFVLGRGGIGKTSFMLNEIKKRVQDKITINEIIQLKDSGLTYREIGTMFGVSRQMIHGLVKKYQSNDG